MLLAKYLRHYGKMTPIKKPILSSEKMGDYDWQYNFDDPATISKTCGFALHPFKWFAFTSYIPLNFNNCRRSPSLAAISKYIMLRFYSTQQAIFVKNYLFNDLSATLTNDLKLILDNYLAKFKNNTKR